MPRRTRALLITLLLSIGLYLVASGDWKVPFKSYEVYTQTRNEWHTLCTECSKRALATLRKTYGDSADMTWTVQVGWHQDEDIKVTRTLILTRSCGAMDNEQLLRDALRYTHEEGMRWPDKVEYNYACRFDAPASLGISVTALAQGIAKQVKPQSPCGAANIGSLQPGNSESVQTLFGTDASVDLHYKVGFAGDVTSVQLKGRPLFNQKAPNAMLLSCAARIVLDTLQPKVDHQALLTEIEHVWYVAGSSDTFGPAPGFPVLVRAEPMMLTFTPAASKPR
jgi:hypothetical protein